MSDDGAAHGIVFRDHLLEKDLLRISCHHNIERSFYLSREKIDAP